MTAEDARTFCEEVIATRLRRCDAFGTGDPHESPAWYLNRARAVLDLLLGVPERPCPECGAGERINERGNRETKAAAFDCPSCHGMGILPAVAPLRRPCGTCEGDPNFDPLTEAGNLSSLRCPDCTDGFSSLAAIDEARSMEQVGYCNVAWSKQWEPETDPAAYPVYRFPAPDRTEQPQ